MIHLVQFYRPTGTEADAENTRGDIPLDPEAYFMAYVSIEPLTGRELMVAREMRADLSHKVTMQIDSRYNHRLYFTWNGRTFNCGPAMGSDGERGFYLEYYAGEIQG